MKEAFLIKNEAKKQGFTTREKGYFYKITFLEHYLKGHKGFIAGGCFKDIFTGRPVKDIDIFFRTEDDFLEAVKYFVSQKWEAVYDNDNAFSYINPENGVRIELIKRVFGTPQYIMSQFDFSVCKFAYMKRLESDFLADVIFGDRFESLHSLSYFEDLALRRLNYDNSIVNPVQSFDRLLRYLSYGFSIDKNNKTKLLESINNLDAIVEEDLNEDNGYF